MQVVKAFSFCNYFISKLCFKPHPSKSSLSARAGEQSLEIQQLDLSGAINVRAAFSDIIIETEIWGKQEGGDELTEYPEVERNQRDHRVQVLSIYLWGFLMYSKNKP